MKESKKDKINFEDTLIENEIDKSIYFNENFFIKIKNSIFKNIIYKERIINHDRKIYPEQFLNNTIDNRNYNLMTFLPKFLFFQFSTFNNFFYLLLTLTQFIEPLKIGKLIGYIFPLAFILILTAIKEIYEEIQKFKKDKIINNSIYLKYKLNNKFENEFSKNLKVGDIIKLKKGDRVPADIVILWTLNEEGITNVKTDQIDGESDWKTKKSLKYTQKYYENISKENINKNIWEGKILIEPPNDNIYNINGKYFNENNFYQKIQLENCIWSNMSIATNELIGLIIYIGKETKLSLNSKISKIKYGKTDKEINLLSMFLIFFILIFGTLMSIFSGKIFHLNFYYDIIRNIILFSQIIPISLKVNLDLSKIFYIFQINNNKAIKGTVLRNSNISEELGRIEYLLCDKTGTLTQNKMIFKTFALKKKIFSNENDLIYLNDFFSSKKSNKKKNNKFNLEKNENKNLMEFFESLILCHNVTPIIDEENKRILQASSPDEVALVNFAESKGFLLLERNDKKIKFKNPFDKIFEYEILEVFPFSSDRKRMGILVKLDDEIKFFLKGADCVINPKLNNNESLFSFEQTEYMSKKGLRTLVFGKNNISKEYYDSWKKKFIEAQNKKNSEIEEKKLIEELEKNLNLLGITGVEDLLQDKVKEVIDNIREAGIKIWMLTGDKAETAKCISISTGFKHSNQKFYEILNENLDNKKIIEKIKKFNKKDLLIISGSILEKILKDNWLKMIFLKIINLSTSVVICRCAPKQKAEITLLIKNYLNKIVCSIGDGGNDVGMIKCASFGIGIEGFEGKQAALSSDTSIPKFCYIEKLLFWHGRLSYLRTCKIFIFCISRGFLVTFTQILYMFIFYYISIGIFNSFLLNLYTTIFTNFLLIGILFDQDLPKEQAFNYPILYIYVQKGRYLNLKEFIKSINKSLFQSFIVIILYILYFSYEYKDIITIIFSTLIIIQIINSYQILSHLTNISHLLVLITLIIYISVSHFFSKLLNFKQIDYNGILIILILSLSASVPFIILNIIKFYFFPSPIDKVIKEAHNIVKRNKYSENKNLTSLKINKVIF